jgi:hypothetical protein
VATISALSVRIACPGLPRDCREPKNAGIVCPSTCRGETWRRSPRLHDQRGYHSWQKSREVSRVSRSEFRGQTGVVLYEWTPEERVVHAAATVQQCQKSRTAKFVATNFGTLRPGFPRIACPGLPGTQERRGCMPIHMSSRVVPSH